MENRMLRFANVELRAKDNEKKNEVEGIACVFDTETDIGWFKEKIDRHAFDNCDMSDVVLNFNHDDNYLLARTTNNSLFLTIDDKGLHQQATIIDTQQGNDIYKMVSEKLITKMSFSFVIDEDGGEEWVDEEHRIIKKIKRLFDVSLVSFPAYPTTEAFARSENLIDELAIKHRKELTMDENKELNEELENKEEVKEEPMVDEVKEEEPKQEEPKEEEKAEETAEPMEEPKEEKSNNVKVEERKMEKDLTLNNSVATENVEARATNKDAYDTPEYRKAFRNYVMAGGSNEALKELRGTPGIKSTDAGVPVPTIFANEIKKAWEKLDIINDVTKSFVKGILKVSHEVSASAANYHTEGGDAVSEEELVLADVTLIPMMVKKWISITDELMAMTDESFFNYIANEVVYQVLKFVQDKILVGAGQGSGSNEGIVGITASSLTTSVTAALDFNAINLGASACDGAEGDCQVVMNRATFYKNIMGLTDLQGRPIYQVALDNTGKPAYFINGLKVKFSTALDKYDDCDPGDVWAIVGDFKAYQLNMPEGENVITLFDPYTLATADKSRMIGRIYAGGGVVKTNSFAKLVVPASA